jgi:hypothetical protein
MSILAVGGEADCFYPIVSQNFAFESTAGRFESTASRHAMKIAQNVSEIELNFPSNLSMAWIHFYMYQETANQTVADWIQIKRKDGAPAFRIGLTSTGFWSLQKFIGSAWIVLVTSTSSVLDTAAANIDIFINISATGTFSVYKDGVIVVTYSGDTTIDNTNFGRIHFKGQTGTTNEMNISQCIIADESTLGFKLITQTPNAAGSNSGWTGDYTLIDDTTLDTADYIETNVVGVTSTFNTSNINTLYSSYNVKAVTVAARGSNDSGSAISDTQAALRISTTNYFSPNLGLTKDGTDYSIQYTWNTNPATLGVWDQTTANAMESGVKSV